LLGINEIKDNVAGLPKGISRQPATLPKKNTLLGFLTEGHVITNPG
jgi:hypothetical protein